MTNWIEKAVGLKHTHKITNKDIAERITNMHSQSESGVTSEYISMVLNGKRSMPNAEQRIMTAISEIISERIK